MEEWKNIEGFDHYTISTKGRLKSLKFNRETIMKPKIQTKGYCAIVLYKSKEHKAFLVHRLTALAFIPNPENKPQINHINGIKTDNCVENLEWCDNSENQLHSYSSGLNMGAKGEKQGSSKLKENQVICIRKSNLKTKELSEIYNVTCHTIFCIRTRKTWRHI